MKLSDLGRYVASPVTVLHVSQLVASLAPMMSDGLLLPVFAVVAAVVVAAAAAAAAVVVVVAAAAVAVVVFAAAAVAAAAASSKILCLCLWTVIHRCHRGPSCRFL